MQAMLALEINEYSYVTYRNLLTAHMASTAFIQPLHLIHGLVVILENLRFEGRSDIMQRLSVIERDGFDKLYEFINAEDPMILSPIQKK